MSEGTLECCCAHSSRENWEAVEPITHATVPGNERTGTDALHYSTGQASRDDNDGNEALSAFGGSGNARPEKVALTRPPPYMWSPWWGSSDHADCEALSDAKGPSCPFDEHDGWIICPRCETTRSERLADEKRGHYDGKELHTPVHSNA